MCLYRASCHPEHIPRWAMVVFNPPLLLYIGGSQRKWDLNSFLNPLELGSPTSGLCPGTSCWIRGGIRLQIKYMVNLMPLNHPKAIACPQSMEKSSCTKKVPGAKKVGDSCFRPLSTVICLNTIGTPHDGYSNPCYLRAWVYWTQIEK